MRVIPRLDIKNEYVIKGINLEGLRKVDFAVNLSEKYYEQNADEIILMDAVASLYKRNNLYELIDLVCKKCFIPVTLGGGISSLNDVEKAMKSGCDKVSINTSALTNKSLISDIAKEFGSQVLMIGIEAKLINQDFICYFNTGRDPSKWRIDDWMNFCQDSGAGEFSVTSIDHEGTKMGPDYELIKLISQHAKIPTIYHGGVRSLEHVDKIKNIFNEISGVAIASALHYNLKSVKDFK